MQDYQAVFNCCSCHSDNDQIVEEPDAVPAGTTPPEKKIEVDCWRCGCTNEVVVKPV